MDEVKVDVKPEVQQESQEYIDKMVAKAEGREAPTTSEESQDQPDNKLLAGKYKTEEDLQKGILEVLKKQNEGKDLETIYKELESGLGAQSNDDNVTETQDNQMEIDTGETKGTGNTDNNTDGDDDGEESKNTQLDFAKYEQELYENNGQLSENSYKELEEQGFPKYVVDQYIRGLQATAQAAAQEVYQITDGQENYQNMINWAKDNLDVAEQNAFNAQVNSNDPAVRRLAVEALYSRYTKANGTPPKNLLQGDTSRTTTRNVYESRAQMMEDMRNPKYKTDPAFRRKVQEKIRRSDIL